MTDPIYLVFLGTQTRAVRARSQAQAKQSVIDAYLRDRGIALRKNELRARRARVDARVGWLNDAGEYLLAEAIATGLNTRTSR